jgi:hypothetical protein
MKKKGEMRKLVQKKYREVLGAAKEGEERCLKGKRWGGNALLIVADAALDSTGLNYFQIVVPRVKRFLNHCLKKRQIHTFQDFLRLKSQDSTLRKIINNERVWRVAIGICKELNRIKQKNKLGNDFVALRFWAERADCEKWESDPIGRISGVGLVTFQYLRMQAGAKTAVPDRIIKRVVRQDFGIEERDNLDFIKRMKLFSKETGYSEILLCWAIWLKEAGRKESSWEEF